MLISFEVTEVCSTQNLSKKLQRAITIKLVGEGLWFMCMHFSLMRIYTPLHVYVQICNSLWDLAPTSLWRMDRRTSGHPDIRTDELTNRTDNAKSISLCLRRGILIINSIYKNVRMTNENARKHVNPCLTVDSKQKPLSMQLKAILTSIVNFSTMSMSFLQNTNIQL